ncbi:hypothetical protein [Kineosporia sp. NBRC 101731]|uniref:hypothetical protein n=1 Tax=Kineosporia sp. NBRC 101731 TaxID=3032199 RepID=UPI0024A4A55E|nr:hypothetical protein [Kineosporia sp. NBRC 101731]GLY32089.1 hypothetical protein Kisp02_54540 [Kineosporia sp. NBRC 101731]
MSDTEATEALGPMCKNCGHRGGKHRPAHPIVDKEACPGAKYDPADVAIYQAANPDDSTEFPT